MISTTVIILGLGIGTAMVGSGIRPHFNAKETEKKKFFYKLRNRIGRVVTVVGLVVAALALYGGCKGPVTIAGVTLEPFNKADDNPAVAYAQKHLSVISGASSRNYRTTCRSITYVIKNKGTKTIAFLDFQFKTDKDPVDIRVAGPFQPGMRKKVHAKSPPTVKGFYPSRSPKRSIVNAAFTRQ